jgi:hypothetical protein
MVAPLGLTRGFTAVVQALGAIDGPGLAPSEEGVLVGVNAALERCAQSFTLLDEIDMPWAATVTGGTATIG